MRDTRLKRLKIAEHLLETAIEHLPRQECRSLYQCKACTPTCKAANIVESALYWVQDVARILNDEEKVARQTPFSVGGKVERKPTED